MPARRCDRLIQLKPRSGVGPTLDDQSGRAARQAFESHTPASAAAAAGAVRAPPRKSGARKPAVASPVRRSSGTWSLSVWLTSWSFHLVRGTV